ncbi:hypothetical protein PMG71_02445 [Roseofilum sp. BLCC_M154]|uniref:Uncharacterized protein n=1 Tax=Roseofilum acuticapitatum BLCC-M154 TaxID=3022444 RepID=A0ABT7AN06_9CYAN|nr:hypothetical protein [Roseofilum acuticapitatum]MDJ1168282.1 hypothetical protein [Roseofilum acuticapitatum BLCC-M154]
MYTGLPLMIVALAAMYLMFVYVLLMFAQRTAKLSRSRSSAR